MKGGRIVDDFVCLPDLAPTFLEAGETKIPDLMSARSLWNVLKSEKSGWVDPKRDANITGRERHVQIARVGQLPYPQRAIRTKDFQFVINFRPDRWPLGDPYLLDTEKNLHLSRWNGVLLSLLQMKMQALPRLGSYRIAPTPKLSPSSSMLMGSVPREELYDLRKDPFQMNNVAKDPAYSKQVTKLRKRLMAYLRSTNDPRLVEMVNSSKPHPWLEVRKKSRHFIIFI